MALQCKDGRPLVAFLGESLPKWTQGLIKLDGLKATSDVIFSEPRTAVRNLHAEGGNFKINGEYDRRGEHSNGAFLIETGILIVGVELHDGKAAVRPLLAKQWFAKARGDGGGGHEGGGGVRRAGGAKVRKVTSGPPR